MKPVSKPVNWVQEVPGSKSMTNRALLLAAQAQGRTTLRGVLFSGDSRAFLAALQALGFYVEIQEEERLVVVEGYGGRIPVSEGEIYVGSAGTAARFLTAMLGVSSGTYVIRASEQMAKRPMRALFEALLSLGAAVDWLGEEWHLPVRITGAAVAAPEQGKLDSAAGPDGWAAGTGIEAGPVDGNLERNPAASAQSGTACRGVAPSPAAVSRLSLDISESTQFLSAFLLIAPMFRNGLDIEITSEKKDGSYIRITRKMLAQFGVQIAFDGSHYRAAPGLVCRCSEYTIEPDVSAACYFYAAAAITGGRAKVPGVHKSSMQGDLKFLSVLEQMGCTVSDEPDGILVCGPAGEFAGADFSGETLKTAAGSNPAAEGQTEDGRGSAAAEMDPNAEGRPCFSSAPGRLRGITVDMNDFSDQALTLAAMAPFAEGPVTITHIAHIRRQESNRIDAIVSNLTAAGIRCEELPDGVRIYPGTPKPCRIATFEDHRVAMSFSLFGLRAPGIVIENPQCCGKTFEDYFDILDRLTAEPSAGNKPQ